MEKSYYKDLQEETKAMMAAEPGVLYGSLRSFQLNDLFSNPLALGKMISKGLPFTYFEKLTKLFPFSENDWASLLDLSTKSIQRYRSAGKVFGPLHSEKLMQLTEVSAAGLEVFGSQEKFDHWLQRSNPVFGGEKPIALIKNSYGKQLVLRELNAINHGIFA